MTTFSSQDSSPLSQEDLEQLDSIRDAFEDKWKSGDARPCLKATLNTCKEPFRSYVLRELLYVDIVHRFRKGDVPRLDNYLQEFPDHHAAIREVFSSEPSIPPEFGSRYRLVGLIGEGGFGYVFRCYDHERERDVAIKVSRSTVAKDIQDRLRQEARIIIGRDLSGVVNVWDVFVKKDRVCIVMQFIHGTPLSIGLENPLDIDRAVKVLCEIAAIVDNLHRSGIIHRDLKPDNILIDNKGKLFVTDFGLAIVAGQTTHAKKAGSAGYMSPEQLRGEVSIDHATDVWSLGVILYRMLTGRLPFQNESEVLDNNATDPREYNSSIPNHVSRACLACLNKDKKQRHASADRLRGALQKKPLGYQNLVTTAALVAMSLLLGAVLILQLTTNRDLTSDQTDGFLKHLKENLVGKQFRQTQMTYHRNGIKAGNEVKFEGTIDIDDIALVNGYVSRIHHPATAGNGAARAAAFEEWEADFEISIDFHGSAQRQIWPFIDGSVMKWITGSNDVGFKTIGWFPTTRKVKGKLTFQLLFHSFGEHILTNHVTRSTDLELEDAFQRFFQEIVIERLAIAELSRAIYSFGLPDPMITEAPAIDSTMAAGFRYGESFK
jgi:serine/threonine protein kinase